MIVDNRLVKSDLSDQAQPEFPDPEVRVRIGF